ncbi:MAG TPA: GIY-YIG nuclease family protein [Caulobacteraceae bacterium]|nr:GIY-YIG nuclease family protein [Caulobacteraceae bacterium]
MAFDVYMLASGRNGTLYIGHTDDLIWRATQHRDHHRPGFTDKYSVTRLVWYEAYDSRDQAFVRERRMKKAPRLEAGVDRALQSGLEGPAAGPHRSARERVQDRGLTALNPREPGFPLARE